MTKKCDVIIDLQFGSTGKGLIAGYMAKRNEYDTVVNANMPNAGHTYIDDDGREWIHKVLPNGIVSPKLECVMIGPGSVFSAQRLIQEIKESADLLDGKFVYIHRDAVILKEEHIASEKASLNGISSTMQGSAAAMISKINRDKLYDSRAEFFWGASPSLTLKDGKHTVHLLVVDSGFWQKVLYKAKNILLEGAQGYSLGLNAGFWPYCTSRDCTPARFMSDCAVPLGMLRRVIGTARMHPIRVGNTEGGTSGPSYADQRELTWEGLGVVPETTTVTGRRRRVFSFSRIQIEQAIMACQPDEIFLNFANYDHEMAPKLITIMDGMMQKYCPNGGSVRYVGWGPKDFEVRERHPLNPCDYTRDEHVEGYVS